jgi:hypothetical protein
MTDIERRDFYLNDVSESLVNGFESMFKVLDLGESAKLNYDRSNGKLRVHCTPLDYFLLLQIALRYAEQEEDKAKIQGALPGKVLPDNYRLPDQVIPQQDFPRLFKHGASSHMLGAYNHGNNIEGISFKAAEKKPEPKPTGAAQVVSPINAEQVVSPINAEQVVSPINAEQVVSFIERVMFATPETQAYGVNTEWVTRKRKGHGHYYLKMEYEARAPGEPAREGNEKSFMLFDPAMRLENFFIYIINRYDPSAEAEDRLYGDVYKNYIHANRWNYEYYVTFEANPQRLAQAINGIGIQDLDQAFAEYEKAVYGSVDADVRARIAKGVYDLNHHKNVSRF